MVKYRHLNLKTELPVKELSKLVRIMDKLPLILEGVHIEGDFLANSDNPATVEALKSRDSKFILQPVKGDKIICYLDSYLVKEGKYELPGIKMFPGWSQDSRPSLEIDSSFEKKNYIVKIFPRAIGD